MQLQLRKPVTLGVLIIAVVAFGGGSAFGAALIASKAPTSVLACMTAKGALVLPTKSKCAKGLTVIHLPLSTKVGPRGPAGPPGVRGATGAPGSPGPSIAYSNAAQSTQVQLGATNTQVTTLTVPTGGYVVTASVALEGNSVYSTPVTVSCTLSGDSESWAVTLPLPAAVEPLASISFTTPVQEFAPTTISLLCFGSVNKKIAADATLVATKVGTLKLS